MNRGTLGGVLATIGVLLLIASIIGNALGYQVSLAGAVFGLALFVLALLAIATAARETER